MTIQVIRIFLVQFQFHVEDYMLIFQLQMVVVVEVVVVIITDHQLILELIYLQQLMRMKEMTMTKIF